MAEKELTAVNEWDKAKTGAFLAQLRREKNMTQKDLAGRLYVTDKAVSKWERGLSMPDASLLLPLAEILGVTVTELLRGERIDEDASMERGEVDALVGQAVRLSSGEGPVRRGSPLWRRRFGLCVLAAAAETLLLVLLGRTWEELLFVDYSLVVILALVFAAHFCCFARETLPRYYDENQISVYYDGAFRMNFPGVYFNNRNWPYILRACRVWLLALAVGWPVVYLLLGGLLTSLPVRMALVMAAVFSLFVPIAVAARRHS